MLLSRFSILTLWKKVTVCSPRLQSGELMPHPLASGEIHTLGLFCMGDLSLFPHVFIHSITYLCQYGFMGSNPNYSILLYFGAQIISALAFGSSFSWLLHPFDIPITMDFLFFEHFLLSGTTRCSRYTCILLLFHMWSFAFWIYFCLFSYNISSSKINISF